MSSKKPSVRPRRRWLSFSTRTLLIATVFITAAFAWFGKYVIWTRIERPIVEKIQVARGNVIYDYQIADGVIETAKTPPGSLFVRSLFGDDIYATVVSVYFNHRTTDADIEELYKLPNLEQISVLGSGVTDQCVDALLRVRKLRCLNLIDTSISPQMLDRLSESKTLQYLTLFSRTLSDAHLEGLHAIPNLQGLEVMGPLVTDEGIKSIASIEGLLELDIFPGESVSDAGLQFLGALNKLEKLTIQIEGNVTLDGVEELRSKLPNCVFDCLGKK